MAFEIYTRSSPENEQHQMCWQFSSFFNQKQDFLRKRACILASLCLDLLSGRRDLAMMEIGGWKRQTCLFLVISHLQLILSLRGSLSLLLSFFCNCHYCLLNVSLCALYCNTLFQDHNGFLYSGTFHK